MCEAQYKHHLIGFGESGEGRTPIDFEFGVVRVVIYFFGVVLLAGDLYAQTHDRTFLIEKDADLVAILISDEFATLDADVLLAVVLDSDVIGGETDGTAASIQIYQSPTSSVLSCSCLLRLSLSLERVLVSWW